jgi:hypothetical protein
MKHKIKLKLKKILMNLLYKLDATSVVNSRKGHSISEIALNSNNLVSNHDENQRPVLVYNSDSSILNKDMLTAAVQAFFGVSRLDEWQQLYCNKLSNKGNFSNAKSLLLELIALVDMRIFKQIPEPIHQKHKLILSKTLFDALGNKIAYSSKYKDNTSSVVWPDPSSKKPSSLFDTLPWAVTNPIIDKQTPIGSAGSCFALEIAHRLQQHGFNYVIKEPKLNKKLADAPANWGIIFNVPALRQMVERSFGLRKLPKLLWAAKSGDKMKYFDPFREDVIFESIDAYNKDYSKHLESCRAALTECKAFVMTVGMNEIWQLRSDKSVFSRAPWNIAPELIERRVLTVEENVAELQKLIDTWRYFNPDIKLIISVSPVPLHATFRGNSHHVVTANCASKSTLRCAVEKFCADNHNVHYFPSYETVMYCTKNPWTSDQRHVAPHAINNVMELFEKMFLRQGSSVNAKNKLLHSA